MNHYYWIELVVDNKCTFATGNYNFEEMLKRVNNLANNFPYPNDFEIRIHVMN